jgi:hypothetical protein
LFAEEEGGIKVDKWKGVKLWVFGSRIEVIGEDKF